MQCCRYQTEKWVCVRGHGVVTRGEEQIKIDVNQAIDNPLGAFCKLENSGPKTLHIIKVKIGSFTTEDRLGCEPNSGY
jgi:mannose-6-phosphate isomerase-like protein (cupin superfamily)